MPRGAPYKIQPSEWPNILKKYLDGVNVRDIADDYNVHFTTIYDILNNRGVRRRKFREEELSQIYALHDNTVVQDAIAALFQTSRRTISRLIKQRDLDEYPLNQELNLDLPFPVDRRTDQQRIHEDFYHPGEAYMKDNKK